MHLHYFQTFKSVFRGIFSCFPVFYVWTLYFLRVPPSGHPPPQKKLIFPLILLFFSILKAAIFAAHPYGFVQRARDWPKKKFQFFARHFLNNNELRKALMFGFLARKPRRAGKKWHFRLKNTSKNGVDRKSGGCSMESVKTQRKIVKKLVWTRNYSTKKSSVCS